jgi:hypothetical protein
MSLMTLAYTPGKSDSAQPLPKETEARAEEIIFSLFRQIQKHFMLIVNVLLKFRYFFVKNSNYLGFLCYTIKHKAKFYSTAALGVVIISAVDGVVVVNSPGRNKGATAKRESALKSVR